MALASICDLLESGVENERYEVNVKIVGNIADGYFSTIKKWGVVADNSGMIRFTIWPNFAEIDLETNNCYNIQEAQFRYNNYTPNLVFDRLTQITQIPSLQEFQDPEPQEFDFSLPYRIVHVRGICLNLLSSVPSIVKQKGIMGNIEGFTLPFVMFHSGDQTPLEIGKVYDFRYASVEKFKNKRELYVDCAIISEIPEETYPVDISGNFTDIDSPIRNIRTKWIFEPIFEKAEDVLRLDPAAIEASIREPLLVSREMYATMCPIDYSDQINQLAYLFGYFPYYIEPIHLVLNSINDEDLAPIIRNGLNINFFGCGPCPELLGLVGFLSEKYPAINNIRATFIDGCSWEPWRMCVIEDIAPEYWDGTVIISEEINCNILGVQRSHSSVISDADIHIVQNVCSDLINRVDSARIVGWLGSLYSMSKPNSVYYHN